MRVLILADESFASRERAMLSRLEVGLADEGVRIVHGIPARAGAFAQPDVFTQSVTYDNGMALSRFWRAQRLVRSLAELVEGEARPADVVHAFGSGAWGIGAEVSRQIGASLALEVWSADLVPAAARLRSGADAAGPLCLVPDAALAAMLERERSGPPVRVAPWGVHTPPAVNTILVPGRAPSVVIIASGRDARAMGAAIEGLAQLMSRIPDLMVFAESYAIQRAGLWPLAKQLGIVDRFTLSADLEARRELALRADVLVLPEARGEHRTITLDAMACGMAVVAAADASVSVLEEGRTARLVESPRAERWAEAIGGVFDQVEGARQLGLSAREHVRQHFRASTQVAAVMDAYEWMSAGEAIPFEAGR